MNEYERDLKATIDYYNSYTQHLLSTGTHQEALLSDSLADELSINKGAIIFSKRPLFAIL